MGLDPDQKGQNQAMIFTKIREDKTYLTGSDPYTVEFWIQVEIDQTRIGPSRNRIRNRASPEEQIPEIGSETSRI